MVHRVFETEGMIRGLFQIINKLDIINNATHTCTFAFEFGVTRDHFIVRHSSFRTLRRCLYILILIGVFMLLQPFAMWMFTYSFIVILVGTIGFIITSHFPD